MINQISYIDLYNLSSVGYAKVRVRQLVKSHNQEEQEGPEDRNVYLTLKYY